MCCSQELACHLHKMVTAPYKYCRVGIIFNLAGHGMCLMALEVLELYDGKLSRTVLRGERGCKAPDLPGCAIFFVNH